MAEPGNQVPTTPEQAPKKRRLGLKAAALVMTAVAALTAIPKVIDNNIEAHPAPTASAPTPETPIATPTAEAPKPTSPEATISPEEGAKKLQGEAINAALSVLEHMDPDENGMTSAGYDNLTLGNAAPEGKSELLASYTPNEKLIYIRSISPDQSDELTLEFRVDDSNQLVQKAQANEQLTTDDFRSAIQDTETSNLLAATAKADEKWLSLSFDENRTRFTDLVDDPNNVYVIDRADLFAEKAVELTQTMQTAQSHFAADMGQ